MGGIRDIVLILLSRTHPRIPRLSIRRIDVYHQLLALFWVVDDLLKRLWEFRKLVVQEIELEYMTL